MSLTEFERSETPEAALSPDHRTIRMNQKDVLERMMSRRPKALRHVWDVEVGRHFLSDCDELPEDVQDYTIRNVAALMCAKYPNAASRFDDIRNIAEMEIGRGYHIVFEFIPRYHRLVFYFVRRAPDAYDGPLRVVSYENVSSDIDDVYCDVIEHSYKYDVEREDLLKFGFSDTFLLIKNIAL